MNIYLKPTATIESTHPLVVETAARLTKGCGSDVERAVKLFYFARDSIIYNIFMISMFPEDFRASFILQQKQGYCVQKAILLAALGRAAGIPSRIALARIKNHQVPPKLLKKTKTNIFPAHGYNQFYLDGRWVGATATFDRGLCSRQGAAPVEFDGSKNAMLPGTTLDGRPYIEYLEKYDAYADLPLEWIVQRTSKIWGMDKRPLIKK